MTTITTNLGEQERAETLFDKLMGPINPILTGENIEASLKKKEGETDEQFGLRMEEYAASFFLFDQAVEELESDIACQQLIDNVEQAGKERLESSLKDDEEMKNIESQLDGLLPSDHA